MADCRFLFRFTLMCSIARSGQGDWVSVARSVDSMDNRQCRERYEIHEKPGLAFGAPGPDELRDLVTTFFKIKTRAPANKIYCELREQTYDRYHRSNMWLKQLFMRMEKSGELERARIELMAAGLQL